MDDLAKEGLLEKQRVGLRPLMDELFKTNRRPSFRNGKLYAEGRPVSEAEINTFLMGHYSEVLSDLFERFPKMMRIPNFDICKI